MALPRCCNPSPGGGLGDLNMIIVITMVITSTLISHALDSYITKILFVNSKFDEPVTISESNSFVQ